MVVGQAHAEEGCLRLHVDGRPKTEIMFSILSERNFVSFRSANALRGVSSWLRLA